MSVKQERPACLISAIAAAKRAYTCAAAICMTLIQVALQQHNYSLREAAVTLYCCLQWTWKAGVRGIAGTTRSSCFQSEQTKPCQCPYMTGSQIVRKDALLVMHDAAYLHAQSGGR